MQVLEALARVLQLTEAAAAHLLRLRGHLPRPPMLDLLVPDSIVALIETWPNTRPTS